LPRVLLAMLFDFIIFRAQDLDFCTIFCGLPAQILSFGRSVVHLLLIF
jgi:hypothetical protein